MPDRFDRVAATEWRELLAELGVALGRRLVVAGERAVDVGRALSLLDGPPIAASQRELVVSSHDPVELAPSAGPVATGLPGDQWDLVLYLRAWNGERDLAATVGEAVRLARPGGAVVLGELDGELLVRSRPVDFPASLLYRAHPEVGAVVAASCVGPAALDMEAIRASLRRVGSLSTVRTTGIVTSAADRAAAVAAGSWRGWARLADDARQSLLAAVESASEGLSLDEREPWHLVRGFKAL